MTTIGADPKIRLRSHLGLVHLGPQGHGPVQRADVLDAFPTERGAAFEGGGLCGQNAGGKPAQVVGRRPGALPGSGAGETCACQAVQGRGGRQLVHVQCDGVLGSVETGCGDAAGSVSESARRCRSGSLAKASQRRIHTEVGPVGGGRPSLHTRQAGQAAKDGQQARQVVRVRGDGL